MKFTEPKVSVTALIWQEQCNIILTRLTICLWVFLFPPPPHVSFLSSLISIGGLQAEIVGAQHSKSPELGYLSETPVPIRHMGPRQKSISKLGSRPSYPENSLSLQQVETTHLIPVTWLFREVGCGTISSVQPWTACTEQLVFLNLGFI